VFPITSFYIYFWSTQEEATNNNNSNWYSSLAFLYSNLPALSELNVTAYCELGPQSIVGVGPGLVPTNASSQPSGQPAPRAFILSGWGLDQPADALEQALKPIWNKFNVTQGILSEVGLTPGQNISDVVGRLTPASTAVDDAEVGVNLVLGSRLWDRAAVLDTEGLEKTFRAVGDQGVQGIFVSGPGVRSVPANSAAVTPAWRRSYIHMGTSCDVFRTTRFPVIIQSGVEMKSTNSLVLHIYVN
jgi:hypothetical protein